jgi:hypothetical protein
LVLLAFAAAARHQVRYNQDLTHGAFLLNKEVKQAVRAELMTLLASSGKAVVGLARQLSIMVQPALLPNQASFIVRGSQGSGGGSGGLPGARSRSWSVGRNSWGRMAASGSWAKSEMSRAMSEGLGAGSTGPSFVDAGSGSDMDEAGCASDSSTHKTTQQDEAHAQAADAECDVAAGRPDQ